MKVERLPLAIPGPSPIPLLGPYGSIVRFFRDPIRCLRELHKAYGTVAAVSGGDASLVCAFGPEINHQVLSNPDLFRTAAELPIPVPKGSSLERLSTILVGMNGEEHHTLRRAMAPLFQRSHLVHHRDGMVAAADAALARWRPGETMDVSAAAAEMALGVAFRCLFDLDITDEASILAKIALSFTSSATSVTLILAPFDAPGLPYARFLRLCEDLERRLSALIRERRQGELDRHDVLSVLMNVRCDDGTGLPDSLLVGLANELFIAGHETTARTLTWTLFLLERHPEVLRDVLDELSGELHGDAPTVDQIERLPLLDAVVKESMRLLSATPFLFFRKNADGVRVGTYDLPPGAAVIISPLITHHMPELYPEPNAFRPQRWTTAKPGAYEYLPFGAGPRLCLGASFATLSIRVMLALILQRYRLTLPAGASVSYQARGIILGSKDGIRMRVDRQDRAPAKPGAIQGTIRELVDLS